MTWTYDVSDLATSVKDQVRMEIGDIVAGAPCTLQDEEVARAIATETNVWGAAARCAELLGRRYALKADVRLGRSLFVLYTTMAKQYNELARQLRMKAGAINVPWAGGMSIADKQVYQQNGSLVQPIFARGMMENPNVGGYSPDTVDDQQDGVL